MNNGQDKQYMMKIAHSINPYLFQTGSWIYNQIRYSSCCNHIVLTTKKQNTDQFPFQPVYSIENVKMLNQYLQKGFRRIFNRYLPYWDQVCRNEGVDLLHSHFGKTGLRDVPFANKLGIPHIVSFYGVDMGKSIYYEPKLKQKYKKMFNNIDGVFVEGPFAKNTIMKLGRLPEKIYVSHLGVALNLLKAKKRLWENNTPFKILITATFTKKKGIIISLKAIEKILRENKNIDIEISLIGDSQQTKESRKTKREILEFVDNTVLSKKTAFFGYLPYKEVLEFGYHHHLLMQTSIHSNDQDCEGGFPVIITDMMATGMPVLGSNHCDIPEIIKHEKNGLLAKEGDINSTSEALLRIIRNYNQFANEWFQFNRNFLKKEFDAVECSKKREKLYKKILQQKRFI